MSDDEELTSRLRAGLAREGAAVEPHTDVADLTDRIATRSRRNQRVLSVAAALLLICGVATGVAVGRSTAKHPTQTASAPTSGGPTAAAPEVAGPTSNAAGEAVNLGVLAKVLSRTANGVTLRVYSVGASTVGGPVESQKSGAVPAPTTAAVPGPCNVSTARAPWWSWAPVRRPTAGTRRPLRRCRLRPSTPAG